MQILLRLQLINIITLLVAIQVVRRRTLQLFIMIIHDLGSNHVLEMAIVVKLPSHLAMVHYSCHVLDL